AATITAKSFLPGIQTARNSNRSGIEVLVVILALRRELQILVAGLRVLENFPLIIPDHDFFVVVIQNVTGINRHFATTARGVDDELRHRITGGMAAERLNDV